jgi:cysteine desulfurase/selenocysteine lyase
VEFIHLDADFQLDFADFEKKFTSDVRVVSLTAASNVTGAVFDLARAKDLIRSQSSKCLFIVDGSQAVPHFPIDVQTLDIDYMAFTGHKCMSDTGIGIMYGKKTLLKTLVPSIGGGGAINWVREDSFAPAGLPSRFEPGTPHIIGAGSLLQAIEFMESIGGYEEIERIEKDLVSYTLAKWQIFKKQFPEVRLI